MTRMATIKPVASAGTGPAEIGQYYTSLSKTNSVTRLASAMARLKKNLMGPSRSSPTLTSRDATIDKETIVKNICNRVGRRVRALRNGCLPMPITLHHKVAVTTDRAATGMVQLHPNDGNPNGNPDGPTTLSRTGNSSAWWLVAPGTSGYNWPRRPDRGGQRWWKAEIASAGSRW